MVGGEVRKRKNNILLSNISFESAIKLPMVSMLYIGIYLSLINFKIIF